MADQRDRAVEAGLEDAHRRVIRPEARVERQHVLTGQDRRPLFGVVTPRDRPLHTLVVIDIDVLIEHVRDLRHPLPRAGQHDGQGLLGVPAPAGLDAGVADVGAASGGQVDILDEDAGPLQRQEEVALDGRLERHHVGAARVQAADRGVLVNGLLAVRDAIDDEPAVVRQTAAVGAGVLAVGPLVVNPAFGGDDAALHDDLGVGRDGEVVGLTTDELGRFAVEPAEDVPVIDAGVADHRRDLVQRRASDDDRDGHVFAQSAGTASRESAPRACRSACRCWSRSSTDT